MSERADPAFSRFTRTCLLGRDENKPWEVAKMLMGTEVKCGKAAGFGVVKGNCSYCPGRKLGRDGFTDST